MNKTFKQQFDEYIADLFGSVYGPDWKAKVREELKKPMTPWLREYLDSEKQWYDQQKGIKLPFPEQKEK